MEEIFFKRPYDNFALSYFNHIHDFQLDTDEDKQIIVEIFSLIF